MNDIQNIYENDKRADNLMKENSQIKSSDVSYLRKNSKFFSNMKASEIKRRETK
jgi:hypothetical protein